LENVLRLMSIPEYYFSVNSEDVNWLKIVKKWGADPVHEGLEIRFKKVL